MWWDAATYLVCAESRLPERLGTDFGKWVALVEKGGRQSVRQQLLELLSVSNGCQSCGIVLQGRHVTKAHKTGSVVKVPTFFFLLCSNFSSFRRFANWRICSGFAATVPTSLWCRSRPPEPLFRNWAEWSTCKSMPSSEPFELRSSL